MLHTQSIICPRPRHCDLCDPQGMAFDLVSNAMAISGICFLIMALFQTARYLRCYDLIIFGFLKFKQLWKNEKFMDKHTGSYGEFLENRRYEKNYGETFAAAVCMFVCSAVVLVI